MKIAKQANTLEFKELAVKRVKDGQSAGAVAKELGLIEQTLRNWVKAAVAGKLNAPGAKVVTPEEMELSRLRAENIRLKREAEILKKRRRTSRGKCCEVRPDCRARQRVMFPLFVVLKGAGVVKVACLCRELIVEIEVQQPTRTSQDEGYEEGNCRAIGNTAVASATGWSGCRD